MLASSAVDSHRDLLLGCDRHAADSAAAALSPTQQCDLLARLLCCSVLPTPAVPVPTEICRRWSVPWLYVGVGGSAVFIIALLCVAAAVHHRQKRPRPAGPSCNAALAVRPHEKRLPTDEVRGGGDFPQGSGGPVPKCGRRGF